ncbi:hypothetical protein H8S90_16365 [Olivibacter sp. SDN3]|uniref:hypothetical protein n=1 Tax=Olivibacter sp. SDN3 TaxID=2764720 RepID=UPI001651628F|nr:hypothetical protein [Olivibacter sp. SDN3]QNL48362.1 hypothetical protein H8S90_16365 [Olivibacter sp. SDN3]
MNKVFNRIFEEDEISRLSKENPDLTPLTENFFSSIAQQEHPNTKVVNITIGDPMKVVVVLEKMDKEGLSSVRLRSP